MAVFEGILLIIILVVIGVFVLLLMWPLVLSLMAIGLIAELFSIAPDTPEGDLLGLGGLVVGILGTIGYHSSFLDDT